MNRVSIAYHLLDQTWVDWLVFVLDAAGMSVQPLDLASSEGAAPLTALGQAAAIGNTGFVDTCLILLSPDCLTLLQDQGTSLKDLLSERSGRHGKTFAVEVRDCDLPAELRETPFLIPLSGLDESTARETLLQKLMPPGSFSATRFDGQPGIPRPPFPGDAPAVVHVPYTRNRQFVGRSAVLQELRTLLTQQPRRLHAPRAVAIVGDHGVGKTELAAEYAARYAPLYSIVWWVRASEPASLQLDLAALARRLSLPSEGRSEDALEKRALNWLASNAGWLLIFDGVTELNELERFIPTSHHSPENSDQEQRGHILFTSLQRDWQGWAYVLPLSRWTRSESVEFLHRADPTAPRETLAMLAGLLQDWPMALRLAGGARLDRPLESLLQDLAEQRRLKPDLGAVGLVLPLLFPQLAPGTGAHDLLCLCAFLGDDIPMAPAALAALAQSVECLRSDGALPAACQLLVRLGIAASGAAGLAIHPLVLAAWREALSRSSYESWARQALASAQSVLDEGWVAAIERQLLPHVVAAARWALELGIEPDAAARLLSDTASHLVADAQGPVAWRLLWQAAALSQSLQPDTLASVFARWGALATHYRNDIDAKGWLKQALTLWNNESRVEVERAECLLNLARLSLRKREHADAREHLEAAQRQLTGAHAAAQRLRAEVDHELAELALQRGELAGADELMAAAITALRTLTSQPAERICALLMRRAVVQTWRGQLSVAAATLREALALAEAALPAGHLSIGILCSKLGLLEESLGEVDQAAEHLKDAHRILQNSGVAWFRHWLGEGPYSDDERIEGSTALAKVILRAGDATTAEWVIGRAVAFLDTKHSQTVVAAKLEQVKILWAAKAPAAAQKLLAETVELLKMNSVSADAQLINALLLDAWLRQKLGDLGGAVAAATDAESRIIEAYGPRHPRLVDIWMARAAAAQAGTEDDSLLKDALAARTLAIEVLGPRHPSVATAAVSMATAYIRLGDAATAEALCREALELDHALYMGVHPSLVRDLEVLADALILAGKLTEARTCFTEAAQNQETLKEQERARPRVELAEPPSEQDEPFRLTHIQLEGFRALHRVTARLERLNVLIGPNGSGKTALLDLFALLSSAMQGELEQGVTARGGFQRLLTLDRARRLRLSLESAERHSRFQPPQRIEYTLELAASGSSYVVAHEEMLLRPLGAPVPACILSRQRERVLARVGHLGGKLENVLHPSRNLAPPQAHELAVAWLSRRNDNRTFDETWDGEPMYRHLLHTTLVPPTPIDSAAPLRHPQALRPNTGAPRGDGSDLLSVLHNLRIEQPEWFQQIEEALRAGFPSLSRLDFPMVGAGQVSLAWYERGRATPVFANELSAGTLRFLLLCTVLLSPTPPQIILLDEPEVSLHPHLLRLLAELLVQCAARSQIFVATHAAALLRWLQPEHVLVIDRDDDGVSLRRGSDLNITDWLESYTLDQLWDLGELGGRP